MATFDKLEQYALALNHSHALHRITTAASSSMAALAEKLTVLRADGGRSRACGRRPGERKRSRQHRGRPLAPHPAPGPALVLARDVHATPNRTLLQPRWAMSFLRGPMALGDIRRALGRG